MREKNIIMINSLQQIMFILLYYITNNKNIFLYVLSISLYNIFEAYLSNISIKDILKKLSSDYDKSKVFNYSCLLVILISLLFILLSIIISDIISILLGINDLFLIYLFMGLSICSIPILNLLTEYLESIKKRRIALINFNLYYILEFCLTILISILTFRVFNVKLNIAITLLYLSKIISIIVVSTLSILVIKKYQKKITSIQNHNVNYLEEMKKMLTKLNCKSIIDIVKKSYCYIAIIVLYLILTTRYRYATDEIWKDLSFIYFYLFNLIEYLIYLVLRFIKNNLKIKKPLEHIYTTYTIMQYIAIIISIISPLVCKVIFLKSSQSFYLVMLLFMAIFIALYDVTYQYVKKKKIIHISLVLGLFSKIILIIPLINAFYRMGYDLIFGDIISTIIGMLISIIINYIYLYNLYPLEHRYLDKFLQTFYDNIKLCIMLIICQFIIPIKTDNYFKSIFLIVVYLFISFIFFKVKDRERG